MTRQLQMCLQLASINHGWGQALGREGACRGSKPYRKAKYPCFGGIDGTGA